MAITYDWYNNEKTAIHLVFSRDWTWDEYIAIQKPLFAMLDSVNHPVHYLVDMSDSRSLPIGALSKLPTIFSQTHPRRGKTVMFGATPIIRNMWNLLQKLIPQMREPRYFFATSMKDAEQLLQSWQNEGQTLLANPASSDENQV